MEPKEIIRRLAIEFAYWIETDCFYNIKGYIIRSNLSEPLDDNEYQLDELYDYWIENVYFKH
jgi:hypothetical protein